MTRVQMTQAVAADYADAMLVARRAKNVLFFFLALVLLLQIGVFFVVRYVPAVKILPDSPVAYTDSLNNPISSVMPSTLPATLPAAVTNSLSKWNWPVTLRFWINSVDFLGIVLAVVLPVILLLIVAIMLVGRLVGVSHVTSAFCWSIVFLAILFPWQTLLRGGNDTAVPGVSTGSLEPMVERPEITFPGVLYTYAELAEHYNFPSGDFKSDWNNIVLKWMRFVGWPAVELILLLMVQGRSSRGLRFALGEAEMPVIVSATTPVV